MPVVKHGFLFTHFEKIVCGVIGLGILVAIVYAMLQLNSLSKEVSPENANGDLNLIRQGMGRKATPVAPRDYASAIAERLQSVPTPQVLRAQVFYPEVAQKYAPVKVAPNQDFVLTFRAPLLPGSVALSGADCVLRVVAHPVGDDFKKVAVSSLVKEGEVDMVVFISECVSALENGCVEIA
jgi:hypothetical protein